MAGTFAEQAQLAQTNAFIVLCEVAVIKRAIEKTDEATKQTCPEIQFYRNILSSPSVYAEKLAWLIASGNATIGAAAPAVPSDADTQYAVNMTLPYLLT